MKPCPTCISRRVSTGARAQHSMCYITVVTHSLPGLLHQLYNLRASKLLIVLRQIISKSLVFMSHPTLPLDRIPAVCYLFPLPPLFTVCLCTTWAAGFFCVPNDNDWCQKKEVIFRMIFWYIYIYIYIKHLSYPASSEVEATRLPFIPLCQKHICTIAALSSASSVLFCFVLLSRCI